jgi:hypothetical protein
MSSVYVLTNAAVQYTVAVGASVSAVPMHRLSKAVQAVFLGVPGFNWEVPKLLSLAWVPNDIVEYGNLENADTGFRESRNKDLQQVYRATNKQLPEDRIAPQACTKHRLCDLLHLQTCPL